MTTLSIDNINVNKHIEDKDRNSEVQKYWKTTNTSCTSSTDSGVNVNDSGYISPISMPSLHMQNYETNSFLNECCEQFPKKNNKDTNCDTNTYKRKIVNNSTQNNFNSDNNIDRVDETPNDKFENFDNKFNVDIGNVVSCSSYQAKHNNIIGSINNCQQEHWSPLTSTASTNDNKTFLQHDENVNLQHRITSTLSTSSLTDDDSDNNLPSNMHHFKGSPIVSIRSITSTIITSDSDSELDRPNDIEGINDNFVIKKLGTQVTYSNNDPGIPHISSGHTIFNQKVIPNSEQEVPPSLDALADIGDRIGAAQALGSEPSMSTFAKRPQIGSIALSNSSDVTFGDKHFYEGPVTIQQFLIDSRDKWKSIREKHDTTFTNESDPASTNNAKDVNSSTENSNKLFQYFLKRKKLAICSVLVFAALLVAATILGSKMSNERKSKLLGNSEDSRNILPVNSSIDTDNTDFDGDRECSGNGTLCLVERDVWRAHPQKGSLDKQELPLHLVIISHTASEPCESVRICADRVRVIQEFHMYSLKWDDIGYNFLISSDGLVFEGRGWDYVGAHTKGYNYDSVGITFIGTYITVEPTEVQLNACLSLLEEGLLLHKLVPDYRLYGARQLGATESPGEMLYKRIKTWKHWSANLNAT